MQTYFIFLTYPPFKLNAFDTTCYPFPVAYATTMCKAQGQTLEKAILWFDIDHIPPGTAYVAHSRVRRLADTVFVTPLKTIFLNQ